jgi:hypothetical protein
VSRFETTDPTDPGGHRVTPLAQWPPVDPFAGFTHADWATLAREYLMAGHLIDRAGMPHLVALGGRELMTAIAIDEWMGASPVYTRRMQRALGFAGDDVATMFKGMQLDIGAPPEFLDFRYHVDGPTAGGFHLDHCGALADVEPMGDEFVHAMCHTIEDPTFEATACASNPRARMHPVHRPPRVPADRHPHCAWTVTIDADADALELPEVAAAVATTNAAAVAVAALAPDAGEHAGRNDYAGDLDADLRMEDFSSAALSVIAQEACVQAHLLVASFAMAVARRNGDEVAAELCARQLVGAAGAVAYRLVRAFDLRPGPADLARLLALHPAFGPAGYVDWRVTVDPDTGVVHAALFACPALAEPAGLPGAGLSWPRVLADGADGAVAAVARALDRRAEVERMATGDAVAAWAVTVGGTAHDEDRDVTLTRFSTGADFAFVRTGRRHPVRS